MPRPLLRAMTVATLLTAAAWPTTPSAATEPAQVPTVAERLAAWEPGLALLHSSREKEALDWFLARKDDKDPCSFYFPALVYTNFDVAGLDAEAENKAGLELLERGIELGEDIADAPGADHGARYCMAALYALRAAQRVDDDRYLAAAFDAKHGRNAIVALLKDEPACVDCRFWSGAYDYFADVLPGIIKFFKTLLFFPKGDKERGLTALEEVGEKGNIDRYNALWTLVSIYNGFEQKPARADELLDRLREIYPDSTDAWLTRAWNNVLRHEPPDRAANLALHEEALRHFEALAVGPADPRVREVKLSLARAMHDDLRPEAAVEIAEPLMKSAADADQEIAAGAVLARALNHSGRYAEALALASHLVGSHPDNVSTKEVERGMKAWDAESSRAFGEILGAWRKGRADVSQGEAAFRELLVKSTQKGLVLFSMGSMYQEADRRQEAEAKFRAAIDAGIPHPPALYGLACMRLGNLLDLRGERDEAKAYYRRAERAAGDTAWLSQAAKAYLKAPFTGKSGIRFP